MILILVFFALAAFGIWRQFLVLRGRSKGIRSLHLIISLALWGGMLPVVLNWEVQNKVPLHELQKGVVLFDRSRSVDFSEEDLAKLTSRIEGEGSAGIHWFQFSDGLTPPAGKARLAGKTHIHNSLEELTKHIEDLAPDWLWLMTDGGDVKAIKLPKPLEPITRYVSKLPHVKNGLDFGISSIETDPVWYTRTETTVRASIFRNEKGEKKVIDVLCMIDGKIVATKSASFAEDALQADVEFLGQSEHLGTTRIEVAIAEGQGGAIFDNDRMLHECQVIRDKIRILRVVGRPTWSSKFLREALVQREDIDLIDFHILRSMHDRVLASSQDLALIPFPVEELFVENIKSFDLIIWQNFDSDTYPFFKRQYLLNIRKFVEDGGGILFWSGGLPWDFTVGDFREMVPVRNRGNSGKRIKGNLLADEPHHLLTKRMREQLMSVGSMSMKVYHGVMNKDSQSLIKFGDHVVLGIKEFGKGRVAQINSDEIWNLKFDGERDHQNIYGDLVNRMLLWLQKHPELYPAEFEIKGELYAGDKVDILFQSVLDRDRELVWEKDNEIYKKILPKGASQFRVEVPKRAGVYRIGLSDGKGSRYAGVRSLDKEFLAESEYEQGLENIKALGFKPLNLKSESPWQKDRGPAAVYRNTGKPWYERWSYFAVLLALIFIHWILVSKTSIELNRKT